MTTQRPPRPADDAAPAWAADTTPWEPDGGLGWMRRHRWSNRLVAITAWEHATSGGRVVDVDVLVEPDCDAVPAREWPRQLRAAADRIDESLSRPALHTVGVGRGRPARSESGRRDRGSLVGDGLV